MSIRVRFPPSPTGYLHVGGARTALFNWLFAKRQGGKLILRIEDTDRERSEEGHVDAILEGLRWLGLDWNEGPFFQSEGVDRHREEGLRLLAQGKAYRDFSDPAELKAEAEERGIGHASVLAREKADTLGREKAERRARSGDLHAVRLLVPEGETRWDDMVHGPMVFGNDDIEDLVLLRSDGSPTYNLAVASDDSHQRITHVIRGDDHLSNTPKQILIYRALGLPVPVFGHVPMILGPDGKRLSKRHGATAVGDYEQDGILPEAMTNFLALLGWNPGDDREVMTRDELIEAFAMERVQRKSAVFDTAKLEWLNGQYLAQASAERLAPKLAARLAERGVLPAAWEERGEDWFEGLVDLLKVRARTVEEMADQALPYLIEEPEIDPEAAAKHWVKDPEGARERLDALRDVLNTAAWEEGPLEEAVRGAADGLGIGAGKVIHPLRVALTGRTASPGIFDVLVLLGRERSLARIDRALKTLS